MGTVSPSQTLRDVFEREPEAGRARITRELDRTSVPSGGESFITNKIGQALG